MSTVLDTSQVEAEVKPFKGILLGLFFLCTGAAVDIPTLFGRFPTIALLTIGLISVKFTITSVSARYFGLTEAESVKVGLTLSQGGEFAFVLLALAQDLRVLPEDLNALLICVVVLSMALTPLLAEVGEKFEAREAQVCSTILCTWLF
jgi:Kef-type K+ transport system membrane component KefB